MKMKKINISSLASFLPVIILIVVFMFLKKAFSLGGVASDLMSFAEGKSPAEKRDEETIKQVVNVVDVKPSGLTMSQSTLTLAVDALDKAMRDWGTDVNKIFEVLRGKSVDDLKFIYKTFGYRKETFFGLTTFGGDLFAWFNAELGKSDLQKVGAIFKPTGLWPYSV